jgi:hypothetical protein
VTWLRSLCRRWQRDHLRCVISLDVGGIPHCSEHRKRFQPILRSFLASIVEPPTLTTLNITVSAVEMLFGLVSMPALGWLLVRAIALGRF